MSSLTSHVDFYYYIFVGRRILLFWKIMWCVNIWLGLSPMANVEMHIAYQWKQSTLQILLYARKRHKTYSPNTSIIKCPYRNSQRQKILIFLSIDIKFLFHVHFFFLSYFSGEENGYFLFNYFKLPTLIYFFHLIPIIQVQLRWQQKE